MVQRNQADSAHGQSCVRRRWALQEEVGVFLEGARAARLLWSKSTGTVASCGRDPAGDVRASAAQHDVHHATGQTRGGLWAALRERWRRRAAPRALARATAVCAGAARAGGARPGDLVCPLGAEIHPRDTLHVAKTCCRYTLYVAIE